MKISKKTNKKNACVNRDLPNGSYEERVEAFARGYRAVKAIEALRSLPPEQQPEKVYGCEVWRNLDWLNDNEKVYLDCSAYPNLGRALSSVFDSQISGGKRYDLSAEGRRLSNATFSESHACDTYTGLNYAMDLTPLVKDKTLDIADYVCGFIERFRESVKNLVCKLI